MAKAAQKPSPEININLLPSKGPADNVGRAISWMLTIGRYLIIFTEIVAIIIFVLSIALSSEKNTLREDIKALSAEVSQQSPFEKHFRQVSGQIAQIKSLTSEQYLTSKVLDEFDRLLPQGVVLDSFILKDDKLTIEGNFPSPSHLQTLISSFSKSDKLVGMTLTKLDAPNDKSANFTFAGEVNVVKSSFIGDSK